MTPAPTPLPSPSPSPAIPPDSEEKTDPGRPVSVKEMRHSNLVNRLVFGLIGAIITSGAGLGGVVAALAMVRSEARAQAKEEVRESVKLVDRVDAGLKGLEARLTVVEQQVPQLRAEVYEQRLETRDLYKAVMDGKRSERLERPPTVPIGRPDGGG